MSFLRSGHVSRQFIRKRAGSNIFMAVEDVSLELPEGKITVLYGPSGSGKSTLLTMMAGILKPSGGNIFLDDTDIYSLSDGELSALRNERIGFIPQGQSAVSSLTLLENVLLPASLGKVKKDRASREKLAKEARELLSRLGMSELEDVMPKELSGGELRRMAAARAFTNDPAVILADEPTADLDPDSSAAVMDLLKDASRRGKAVMIVTHDSMVMGYADYTYIMEKGRLREHISEDDAGEDKSGSYEKQEAEHI